MTTINDVYENNHKIAERTKVILYMIKNRSICDADVTKDLLFGLIDQIKHQMEVEESEFFKHMLTNHSAEIKTTANNFLSSSAEIKRVLKQYLRRWTAHNSLRIKDHEAFIEDSNEVFEMVQNHIILKTEKLYPVVRSILHEVAA